MTKAHGAELTALAEVAGALLRHGLLRCCPSVEINDDGQLHITITVAADPPCALPETLHALELFNELRHVCEVSQLRALSARFGIPPAALEPYLTLTHHHKGDDT